MGLPGYSNPNWYYQLVENFRVNLQAKNLTSAPCFSRNIARICKLLISGNLGMPGAHTQNDNINLNKTFMFICMPKINFITHFFLRYYILKNPAISLADSILTQFCQIWNWWWNINNISFHFRLFPRKTKFLKNGNLDFLKMEIYYNSFLHHVRI